MGKHRAVSEPRTLGVIEDGKQRPPSSAAAAPCSILTADEYRNAVISLVRGVEDDISEGPDRMLELSSALRRLLLARYDPPLPLFWTLIAVEKSMWLDTKSTDPLELGENILNFAGRVFESLRSVSAVNTSGRTALSAAAHVVGLLYDVASLLSTSIGSLDATEGDNNGTVDHNSRKRVRKLARKLKESVRELLGFSVLCRHKDTKAFERSFSLPPAPNVPLEGFADFLHPPFPLASKKMAKSLRRDLSNNALVAGIVSGEVALLQLVVETIDRRILLKKQNSDFNAGQDEFVQALKNLALHSVWPASSPFPSEMILDLLLGKRLPCLDLLDAKEEILLRGVLFETVLVDPPLFSLFDKADEEWNSSKSGLDRISVAFMKKLLVARRAVAFFRSREERSRLLTLLTDMTTWHVPQQLLKWLNSQKKQRLPAIALQNQQTLIYWLVNKAEKSEFSALLDISVATGLSGPSSVGTVKPVKVLEVEMGDVQSDRVGDDLFFVDTAGETQTAVDSNAVADLDFTAAAKTLKGESEKVKRKEKKKQSEVLFHRHEQSETGTKRSRTEVDDVHLTSSSGSDGEDCDENGSKSAKKVRKSKRKVVHVIDTSEEDEDDNSDHDALASAQIVSRDKHSPPVEDSDENGNKSAKKKTVNKSKRRVVHVIDTSEEDGDDAGDGALASAQIVSKEERSPRVEDSDKNESKSAKKKVKKSKRKVIHVIATSEEDEDDDGDGALASAQIVSREEPSPPVKDSDENGSKSAKKKMKKSKRKVVHVIDKSGEDEDDDSGGALASASIVSREERSPPVRSGDVDEQQEGGLNAPQSTETIESVNEEDQEATNGEFVEEDAVKKASSNNSTDSGVNSGKTNNSSATTKGGNVSPRQIAFAEEDPILSANPGKEDLGSGQAEYAKMHAESEENELSPLIRTLGNLPFDSVISEAEAGVHDPAGPEAEPAKSPVKNAVDGKVSQGNMTLGVEKASTEVKMILGSRQAEKANARMDSESEANVFMPDDTQASLQADLYILGGKDGAQDTARPNVEPTKFAIENVAERTRRRAQGTPTSAGSEPRKNKDAPDTRTSREKRPKGEVVSGRPAGGDGRTLLKGQAREEELCATRSDTSEGGEGQDERELRTPAATDRVQDTEIVTTVKPSSRKRQDERDLKTPEAKDQVPDAEIVTTVKLSSRKRQDERELRTPEAKDQVLDAEIVTTVKPSSRKRKGKPATPQGVGSEITDEILYQRQTRSGRALGTPTSTPTQKGNMRRKLALEPLDEEK